MSAHCSHCDGPTAVTGHRYVVAWRKHEGAYWWRWTCSCGGRGYWNAQSDSAAYHSWVRHVHKATGRKVA